MTAYQPVLPGLDQDRRAYVRIRLGAIDAAVQAYERAPKYWTHSVQSCTCRVCADQRELRAERGQLIREADSRASRDRAKRAAAGPRRRANRPPETTYDYNGIGESGFREGWDYWD